MIVCHRLKNDCTMSRARIKRILIDERNCFARSTLFLIEVNIIIPFNYISFSFFLSLSVINIKDMYKGRNDGKEQCHYTVT